MAVQQIPSLPHYFLYRRACDFHRFDRLELRLGPALMDLLRLAHQADGVNFCGRGQSAHRHRHVVAAPFRIDDILKNKRLALALVQTAKLPAHQRHQFSVLIDIAADANQFAALLKRI